MHIGPRCAECGHHAAGIDTLEQIRRWCEENGYLITADGAVYEDVAARLLDRAPGTLANWRTAGTGPPYYRSGRTGRVRYRLTDIAAIIDASRVNE